jgi:glycosyltransferase involved in cell wall biosynthesis
MLELSVVLPVYMEAGSLEESGKRLISALEGCKIDFELIYVNDGSTDNSEAIAESLALADERVRVVSYYPNRGKGAALLEGFALANAQTVAFFDGDLDIHPSCLPEMFKLIKSDECDVVVGSKIHRDSIVVYPRTRRLQSFFFRLLVRMLFSIQISDTQTGVKVFRREILETTLPFVKTKGFAHDLELLVRIHKLDVKVMEVPVIINFQFTSSVSAITGFRALHDTWRIFLADRFGNFSQHGNR